MCEREETRSVIDEAIRKITDEMMKLDNPVVTKIEEHLTSLCTSEEVARKLLDPGKTLGKMYENIRNEMRPRAHNQVAVAEEEEVYQMARDYFGISEEESKPNKKLNKTIDVLDLL